MTLSIEQQQHMVYDAIAAIAAHCDGAIADDTVGFNGQDTRFGRRIASMTYDQWTEEIHAEAARLARRYMVQASSYGHDVGELPIVVNALKETNHVARDQARAHERKTSKRFVRMSNDTVTFSFPYDDGLRVALKAQGAKWNGSSKVWWLSKDALNANVVALAEDNCFNIADDVAALFDSARNVVVEQKVSRVTLRGETLFITLEHHLGSALFSEYRKLDGYFWDGGNNSRARMTARNVEWLADHGFDGAEGLKSIVSKQLAEKAARETAAMAASRSAESNLDLSDVVPDGLTPHDFQVAGVDYVTKARRAIIGDEMGLGKTIQAILAVKKEQTYPVVVIVPASLKGNWGREIGVWDPGATVSILSGRTPNQAALNADWVIVNYDIVDAWKLKLETMTKGALVLDESHYVKNPKAKRTKAITKIARSVPQEGLVVLLTGTPILNRPIELVTQLDVLGRLADVAPESRKGDLAGAFKYRYCGPTYNGYGWEFKGASNLDELNVRLRATCMVRRERADVLDMSETVRIQVPLSLNGKLDHYKRAEDDVIAYIRAEMGESAARKAHMAEVLVQLNLLRRLAEEAKVEATIEWVQDWLESYPEKKLVIFSSHVTVQKALKEAFSCPSILGGESDPEAQKRLFQEGEARVIVCSLQAAREGHTLTAASDVVFTSLGWTPGGLQQAEDRCNRIGQTADKVVAWQLHAANTIDEKIGSLIEAKRAVFQQAIIGESDGQDEADILDGVISYLRDRG